MTKESEGPEGVLWGLADYAIHVPLSDKFYQTLQFQRAGLGELMFHTVWAPLRTLSTCVESTIFQLSMLIGSVGSAVVFSSIWEQTCP